MDSLAWFSGDQGLKQEDIQVVLLSKGEAAVIPWGRCVVWTHVPTDGKVGKEVKTRRGKIVVQWVLPDVAPETVLQSTYGLEFKNSMQRILASRATSKPWCNLKDKLEAWFAPQKPGS